jgi:hypothetical protein
VQPTPPRDEAEAGFVEDSREAAAAPDPEQERAEARRGVQEGPQESEPTAAPRSRGSALGRLAALFRRRR